MLYSIDIDLMRYSLKEHDVMVLSRFIETHYGSKQAFLCCFISRLCLCFRSGKSETIMRWRFARTNANARKAWNRIRWAIRGCACPHKYMLVKCVHRQTRNWIHTLVQCNSAFFDCVRQSVQSVAQCSRWFDILSIGVRCCSHLTHSVHSPLTLCGVAVTL